MGRVGSFLAGMITGAAAFALVTHYHIVRGRDGVYLVRKVQNDLSDIYVDTRQFSTRDWMQHRMLALAIMRADRGEQLADSATENVREGLRELFEAWMEPRRERR